MRILAALICLILLATFAPPDFYREEPVPANFILIFERVPLDPADPGRRSLGRLRYLDGWNIESNDPRFGGISAMQIVRENIVAMSDAGTIIRFAVPGSTGQPAPGSTGRQSIEPLPAGPGSTDVKGDRDSESMIVHGGRAWIGFERSNAVWRYRLGDWRSQAHAAPQGMRKWRSNRGSEAMLRLPDGRFLVFCEGGGGESPVLLFEGDPAVPGTKAELLRYRPPQGYRITDAALLPGGRLLFLNRRVALLEGIFSARLTMTSLPRLEPGSVIEGEEIATLRKPLTVDNMEALSVTREGGRTIVWIASDDNFNPLLQRTLLLKFELAD
jgi:hypothetical protein